MVTEKRATFNEVAELYDKARNHYPDSLFDELHKLTQLPSAARIMNNISHTQNSSNFPAWRICIPIQKSLYSADCMSSLSYEGMSRRKPIIVNNISIY